MSFLTQLDPLGSDVSEDLRCLAQVLAGSIVLRIGDDGVFLFAPIEPVHDDLVDATLTIEDRGDGPDRAAILVFPDEGADAGIIVEQLDGVPDPPFPNRSSVWHCKRTKAPASVVLEIRVSVDDTQRFELHQIRPLRSARPPSPVRKKRREPPGNLKRRSDWFQGGTQRR